MYAWALDNDEREFGGSKSEIHNPLWTFQITIIRPLSIQFDYNSLVHAYLAGNQWVK